MVEEKPCKNAIGAVKSVNVKQIFTSLGNVFFTLYGKQFFTSYGKEFFILEGKQFFVLLGKHFFTYTYCLPCQVMYLFN